MFVRFENAIGVVDVGNEQNFDEPILVRVDVRQAEVDECFGDHFRGGHRRRDFDHFETVLSSTQRRRRKT